MTTMTIKTAIAMFMFVMLLRFSSQIHAQSPNDSFQVAKQFVRSVQNVAAGDPSSLWTSKSRQRPLPTNKFWQNFVLKSGTGAEYIHPYSIQSKNRSIAISYPKRLANSKSISQIHTDDLIVSTSGGEDSSQIPAHVVERFDDLSVTINTAGMRVPLVRGSPYVTFILDSPSVPTFSSNQSILNVTSSQDSTKHMIFLDNNQKWIIYSTSAMNLAQNGLIVRAGAPFQGVIRVAGIDSGNAMAEPILDRFRGKFPTGGRAIYDPVVGSEPRSKNRARITYKFSTQGDGELLMLGLPLHRSILRYANSNGSNSSSSSGLDGSDSPSSSDLDDSDSSHLNGSNSSYDRHGALPRAAPQVRFSSIDGQLQGVIGETWILRAPRSSIGAWHSSANSPSSGGGAAAISTALAQDISALKSIDTTSTYFFGKAVARAARLAVIAEEIGRDDLKNTAAKFLDRCLSPWFDGSTPGNAIVYDSKWGGIVSQNGAFDSGADFGLGVYNDHHYHWGYFVYAGAVLAKIDPNWGSRYRTNLYSLAGDYMSPGDSPNFPRFRHFDPWVLHSWAGGLTEFSDGRNQESTSEAVNAYYAAKLLGDAYGDESLSGMGNMLAIFEAHGAKSLWHVPQASEDSAGIYEREFSDSNRITGIIWANKRDSNLWFSCGNSETLECRLGIQVIPITPASDALFDDRDFNRELFNWAAPSLSTDAWKAFAFAVQATYDPATARSNVLQLQNFDDGNSLSNMLWWVYTRSSASMTTTQS